jgi:TRAP-type mannitol/chloroaromatic compound transport system permease large subunit
VKEPRVDTRLGVDTTRIAVIRKSSSKSPVPPVRFRSHLVAVLVMVNLQISFLTPPFAYSIFYLKGITPPEVKTTDIYRGVVPFVGLQIVGLSLCILFPVLITYLPGLMIR